MRRFVILLIGLMMLLPLSAQIRGNNIVVTVVPNHKDWNYKVGETAKFEINVRRSATLIDNVSVDIEAGPVMYPDSKVSKVLKAGSTVVTGKLSKPGFYRVKATAHIGGKDYVGMATAAFAPELVRPYCEDAADFDGFWKRALDEVRVKGLNAKRRLLPGRCTENSNVYEVSYTNGYSRIYGILSVPVKEGRYPALLRVPGAGVRPYGGDTYTGDGKCIVLEIGVHGIPVTMEQKVYDDLLAGALNNYWDTNIADPNRNAYKRIVTGAVRGVDFIASLKEWDGKTIGVTGASQGGFLSLATAALDNRITFLAAVHDAMCDYEAEVHGVAGGWPHYFYKSDLEKGQLDAKINGARYYDGVNFARRCHVPAWFSFGYNDDVVPPTSSYGVYNIYPAEKHLSVYQMTGHFWYQEQWDEWQQFLQRQLGINNK